MVKKLTTGYKIAAPGFLVALVCFFLPWVLQSCGTEPMRPYSGWQLAIGSGAEGDGYTGNPFVMLSFIAILILVLLAIRSTRRVSLAGLDTYGVLLTSIAVLLFIFQQFLTTPSKGLNREILYGLWGYIAGWLLILIGGVVNMVEKRSGNK